MRTGVVGRREGGGVSWGQADVRRMTFPGRRGSYEVVKVGAGVPKVHRVVPPAGDNCAFDVTTWTTNVEIYVSPTGRSVRIYVNGEAIKIDRHPPAKPETNRENHDQHRN